MGIKHTIRLLVVSLSVASVVACTPNTPPAAGVTALAHQDDPVSQAVAAAGGYAADAVEVLSNAAHLRVAIHDVKLAKAEQSVRKSAADAVVLALEQTLAGSERLAALQSISVAFVHPPLSLNDAGGGHLEDVFTYYRAASGRFARHLT